MFVPVPQRTKPPTRAAPPRGHEGRRDESQSDDAIYELRLPVIERDDPVVKVVANPLGTVSPRNPATAGSGVTSIFTHEARRVPAGVAATPPQGRRKRP